MSTAALQTLYGFPNFAAATVVVTGKGASVDSVSSEWSRVENKALFMPPPTWKFIFSVGICSGPIQSNLMEHVNLSSVRNYSQESSLQSAIYIFNHVQGQYLKKDAYDS